VRIATLRGAGAQIVTPDDVARALRTARGQDEELMRQARRNAEDAAGRAERQEAIAPNVRGGAEVSPRPAAFEGMKEQRAVEGQKKTQGAEWPGNGVKARRELRL
jgi:hypothetical protein